MKKLILLVAMMLGVYAVNAQTRTAVKVADLPKVITENITGMHKGWTPVEAFKVDTKGVMTYEVTTERGQSKTCLVYDKDGKYLKMEPMKPMGEKTAMKEKPKSAKPKK